ncbi:MAG: hypothetical protein U0802_25560 [Candidatus Binatia bacterium]
MTPELLSALAAMRARRPFPLLIDPKRANFAHYRGASLLTLNRDEASQAAGIEIRDTPSLLRAGAELLARWEGGRGAHHPRRAGHVAVRPRRGGASSRPSRARSTTSPAPATPWSRPAPWRSAPAPAWRPPPCSPTTPPASSSARSARRR